MNLALRAGALALVCSMLAACATPTPGGELSAALSAQQMFTRVCAERPNAYALFLAYDAVKPVSVDVRRTVRVSNRQIVKTCANPPASLAEAAVTVTRAIVKIRRAAGRN